VLLVLCAAAVSAEGRQLKTLGKGERLACVCWLVVRVRACCANSLQRNRRAQASTMSAETLSPTQLIPLLGAPVCVNKHHTHAGLGLLGGLGHSTAGVYPSNFYGPSSYGPSYGSYGPGPG
jgi:hypothetical protein